MSKRYEEYSAYLRSEHWRILKIECYRISGRKCEVCGEKERVEAHHLTYREPLESCTTNDIMLLCPRCHEITHWHDWLSNFMRSDAANHSKRKAVHSVLNRVIGQRRLEKVKKKRKEREQEEIEYLNRRVYREGRPRKRWQDYSPDKVIPQHIAWQNENY